MRYLRTMVIQRHIIKQTSGPSKRSYTYPEKALEEAITNAFYHRDYRSRIPIVVEVLPYEITISSATGPDRSIPMDAIQKGQRMISRYYRNRRLGEFLKELSLTEGRNTGIPTIQRELAHNGSPVASFETDEDRLSFLVRIPCHEGEEGVSPALFNDKETTNDGINDGINQLGGVFQEVYKMIAERPEIIGSEIMETLKISESTVTRSIRELKKLGFIKRDGSRKNGCWTILK